MIELYKRYVLWNCRVIAKIPGYRKYGRWVLKHYERNFWRTWTINMVFSIATYFGMEWLLNRWMNKQEKDGLDRIIKSCSRCGSFGACVPDCNDGCAFCQSAKWWNEDNEATDKPLASCYIHRDGDVVKGVRYYGVPVSEAFKL